VDKKEIENLKNKYGKIYVISTMIVDETGDDQDVDLIFKKPVAKAYDRFIKDASRKPSIAFKNLAISSVIEEHKEKLEKLIEDYPASPSSIAKELLRLMGLSDVTNLKLL
jgi:hypothetical protein